MSRGIERDEAVPADGSTRMILMVSLRWPPALVGAAEVVGLGRGLAGPAVRADQQHVVGLPARHAATHAEHGLEATLPHS